MPRVTDPETIVLKCGELSHRAGEALAASTITPGDLIAVGSAGTLARHATAGGYAEFLIAKEDTFQGKTINDNYAANDVVFFHYGQAGDEVYAWVAAAAVAIVNGDYLTSDGAGGFKKASSTDQRIGVSIEALDNSAGGARARLRVRKLL